MKTIYETIVICDPTLQADALNSYAMELKRAFQLHSNKYIVTFEDLGEKTLAYKIKSHTRGHYILYTWEGDTTDTITIQSILQKNPHVLKFLTTDNSERELQPIVDIKSLLYYYY